MQETPECDRTKYCSNCDFPMESWDSYCGHCGQRYRPGRLTFKDLMHEFAESVFEVDSKTFRTIAGLFVPGKLTIAFNEGRRRRYVHPLRVFLVSGVVFFAMINFITLQDLNLGLRGMTEGRLESSYRDSLVHEIDTVRQNLPPELQNDREVAMALDSVQKALAGTSGQGYNYLLIITWPKGYLAMPDVQQVRVSTQAYFLGSPEALMDRHGIKDWVSRLVNRQVIKLNRDPTQFSNFLLGHLSWMILLMMPALALLLKLLYIRRDYNYPEHLVFLFHDHALVFLALSVAVLWDKNLEGPFTEFLFLALVVYLYISMRRVYKQGWFRTFVKFSLLGISYIFLFGLFLALNFAVSALLF